MRSTLLVLMGLTIGLAITVMALPREHTSLATSAMPTAQAADQETAALGPEDLLSEADIYDREADQIQAEVMEYKRRANSIQPLTDTKGFRRAGMLTAAAAKSKAVAELRQLAAHYRVEAKRMMASSPRKE